MPKCADCGYLALLDTETGRLTEVLNDDRDRHTESRIGVNFPRCYLRSTSMPPVDPAEANPRRDAARRVHAPNECSCFTLYYPNFSPREHLEMDFREAATKRMDALVRFQMKLAAMEIFFIVLFGVFSIWTAFTTTRMQIQYQREADAFKRAHQNAESAK